MAIHVLLSIAVAYSTTYGDEPGREYLEAMQRSAYESGVLQELLRQRLREEHLDEVALAAEVSAIDMQAEEARLLELQPPSVRDAAAVPVGRQLEEYTIRAASMAGEDHAGGGKAAGGKARGKAKGEGKAKGTTQAEGDDVGSTNRSHLAHAASPSPASSSPGNWTTDPDENMDEKRATKRVSKSRSSRPRRDTELLKRRGIERGMSGSAGITTTTSSVQFV
jgi:hypothetical protein